MLLIGNFSNLNINSNLTIGSNLTIAGNIFNANSIIGTTESFNTVVLNNYASASGSIILKLPSTNLHMIVLIMFMFMI
jgi:hypothetical protein